MPRLTDIDSILFEVEEHPLFVSIRTPAGERRLAVADKRALVNTSSGALLGIVSRSYRVVTNREAWAFARSCCRAVFPNTSEDEWKVETVDAPGTGGHCFIDLSHNSTALDFSFLPPRDRPDAFGPFIRVTNSYNGRRALAFDIGFYRKVCRNGLILPSSVIRFKFTHLRRDIGDSIEFIVDREKLERLNAGFGKQLEALRECPVPRDAFDVILPAVLRLRSPKPTNGGSPESRGDWLDMTRSLAAMRDRYIGSLGENAYALFNVLTEFASSPPTNRCIHRERHSFQRLVGAWVVEFSAECRKPGFRLTAYLDTLNRSASQSESAPSRPGVS